MKVVGVELYDRGLDEAVEKAICTCASADKLNRLVSATGAHGIVLAKKNPWFQKTLGNFFMNLPDGMPAVWVGRLKGASSMKRCYGPDFFKRMMSSTKTKEIRHYLCGGKEGVPELLKNYCEEELGNRHIVGTYSPPFRDMKEAEIRALAKEIDSLGTDIVWVGLSTPKQELFAERLASFTSVHLVITVGAAFDFHTGRLRQAPATIQKAGMEWFFRLLMEPQRLSKRYFEVVPLFFYFALMDVMSDKMKKYFKRA